MLKFSLENDTLKLKSTSNDLVQWEPNIDAIDDCKQVANDKAEKYCHNYVRLISVDSSDISSNEKGLYDRILVCGSYAYRPICTWRSKKNIKNVFETFDGIGKVPQASDASLSYTKLENGDYYFATSIDYTEQGMKADFLIERSIGSSIQLRTDQYNSNWLNGILIFLNLFN